MPSGPNHSQRLETLMASLSRTISIKFPTDPHEVDALRKQIGLSNTKRRNRAAPDRRESHDRGFLTFGRCEPSGLNLPYNGDVS